MLPYVRKYPQMIMQDPEKLLKITNFDYDLNDDSFVRYFEDRTGYKIKYPTDDGRRPNWETALAIFGDTTREPAENWQKITKGKLQDAWELYKERR